MPSRSLPAFLLKKRGTSLCLLILLAAPVQIVAAEAAGNFDFVAAPDTELNRMYRLDKATGEVGACQFGIKDGTKSPVGVTLCYATGEGAGPQGSSDYALLASHHSQEGGVWRVDLRTGTMSICYVLADSVVCTPPSK